MSEVSDLILRPLASFHEGQACVKLQEEVWGVEYSEKVPAALLMLANRIGGLTVGAFDSHDALQGFVFGLTGWVGGEIVHWSDTLAVRRGFRDRGLGTRLKLYQREVLLGRGVVRMHWTFDPLHGRNAHVNFAKLGIVCREYASDMYGETGSPLHRGMGTDRMVATWEMDSGRVEGRLGGAHSVPGGGAVRSAPQVVGVSHRGRFPEPAPPLLDLHDPRLLVAVPAKFDEMRVARLPLAALWREVTGKAFLHYLSRGYEVREFLRGGPVSEYVLAAPESEQGERR